MRNEDFRANLAQKTNPKRTHFSRRLNSPKTIPTLHPTAVVANYGFSISLVKWPPLFDIKVAGCRFIGSNRRLQSIFCQVLPAIANHCQPTAPHPLYFSRHTGRPHGGCPQRMAVTQSPLYSVHFVHSVKKSVFHLWLKSRLEIKEIRPKSNRHKPKTILGFVGDEVTSL
jgi:hypothetical protein